jgi:hypothetical protein
MGRYPEADLEKVRRISIDARESKVSERMMARLAQDHRSFSQFWDGLPDLLGAHDLRALARAIVRARRGKRPIVWMSGAHVVKVGLTPLLNDIFEQGFGTLLGVNGAFAIHDAELALFGRTSEEVARELHEGRFGMVRETAGFLNGAVREAAQRQEGFGEAVGRCLHAAPTIGPSVLGTCFRLSVPATVHVAIGTDIVHQHPDFDGGAAGEASARDFRILAAHLMEMAGAVVINVGSAVLMPEVFLKAFSVAVNQGARPDGLVTATLDFQKQYRPMQNVVQRPSAGTGRGYYIVGHHEIMLPLLYQGILLEQERGAGVDGR